MGAYSREAPSWRMAPVAMTTSSLWTLRAMPPQVPTRTKVCTPMAWSSSIAITAGLEAPGGAGLGDGVGGAVLLRGGIGRPVRLLLPRNLEPGAGSRRAVFADVGVSVIAILNAMRALGFGRKGKV